MTEELALDDYDRSRLLGREFLLWLWAMTELHRGAFELANLDDARVGLMVDDEIVLCDDEEDGGTDILRAGDPAVSDEAAVALRTGKKPRQLRLSLVRDQQEWRFTLDERLQFRSVRLPDTESDHPADIFGDQMDGVRFLDTVVDALFTRFVEVRLSDDWKTEVQRLGQWITEKQPEA